MSIPQLCRMFSFLPAALALTACGSGSVVPGSHDDEQPSACKNEEDEVDEGGIPDNGFTQIVSRELFQELFPCNSRHLLYTYIGLAEAANSYPEFVNDGDETTRRREAAAFFANIAQETGELVYTEEINKRPYCTSRWGDQRYRICDEDSPPASQREWYYGRGPIQLTWNPNYGAASEALGYELELLEKPYLVASDAKIAWQTGVWFWMTCADCGFPPHQSMVNDQGFGNTIRAINGGLECGQGEETSNAQRRITFYQKYAKALDVTPGDNLGCAEAGAPPAVAPSASR